MTCEKELCNIFKTIVLDSFDPVIVIDKTYKIIIINNAMKNNVKLFGTDIQEGLYLNSKDLMEPFQFVLEQGVRTKQLLSTSQTQYHQLYCFTLTDSNGSIIGAYGIVRPRHENHVITEVDGGMTTVLWATDANGNIATKQVMWEKFTGSFWEDYGGQKWIQYFHTDDHPILCKIFHTDTSHEVSVRLWSQKHCHHVPVKLVMAPLCNEQGKLDQWIASIVVQQKTRQQLVEEDKFDFQKLADVLPQLVWVTSADGYADYFNKKWFEYSGSVFEQCRHHGWIILVHPDDIQLLLSTWSESVATGTRFECRFRMRRQDGVYRWFLGRGEPLKDAHGKIMKWVGTSTDIDDFVDMESQISLLTEQLNMLLSSTHVGLWSVDFRTGIVAADKNCLDLWGIKDSDKFGYTLDEILERVHHDDRERTRQEINKAIEQHIIYDVELKMENSERTLAGRGQVFWDAEGKPVRMTGFNWDITTRKLLEQDKLKALEFAEEQNRQRIKEAEEHRKRLEEFVDTTCHEIRNPLNGITGMISLMESSLEPVVENRDNYSVMDIQQILKQILEYVHTIEQCAEQQRIIVDDVLDLSKAENDKLELSPTIFNLKNLLENLRSVFLGSLQAKKLECHLEFGEGMDSSFKADAHRLSQIIMNLVSNAIKFTESGSITVSVSKEFKEHDHRLLHFSVTDSGIGMNSEEIAKLFNKFSQANASIGVKYGGSGLGLVISKKLVELMGGTFSVQSEKGKGTQFRFCVKCKEIPAFKVPSTPSCNINNPNHITFSPKRILIVEDSVINQKILASYLQQQRCLCTVVNNGLEALSACEQLQYDLIFMDLEMPVMGGLEATRQLRKKQSLNHDTPIVGLSGNARKEHVDEALKSGMDAYLTKPYHKTDIYKVVIQLCDPDSDQDGKPVPARKKAKVEKDFLYKPSGQK